MRTRAVALAGAVVVLVAAAADAQPRRRAASAAAPLDVPYVAQEELLCGGAAAAMLFRYWGARGVYAEDFARLVDRGAGGITTSALARAVREKGWRTGAVSGNAGKVRDALARRVPVIALIEDRPGRNHYVVIVAWADGSVLYHDPARGPLQSRDTADFDRAWAATKRWAMVVTPGSPAPTASSGATASMGPSADGADGGAMSAFEDQDYRESARLAGQRVHRDPEDAEAWRILGASLYLESRTARALDAWNHIGEPRVDLVTFEGLERTPYRGAEQLVGIAPRDLLTSRRLRRADRRLALLPSAESSTVGYTALPGGLAEVTGAIVEEPTTPRLTEWLVQGIKVPFTRQVSVGFGNVLHRGEHWSAMWRFHPARPAVRVGVDLPAGSFPGVWSIDAGWEKNTFEIASDTETSTTRRDGRLGWTDWIAADTRVTVGAGVARWKDRGAVGLLDAGIQQRAFSDRLALGIAVSGTPGAASFGTTVAHVAWRSGTAPPLRVLASVVAARASARAPMDLWPYAGAGSSRELLLRGHDLRESGTFVRTVYGRSVNQGTIEVQRDVYARGPASLAIAGFVDVARIGRRVDGSTSPFEVDPGIGLRFRPGIGDRVVRIDLARALRDRDFVLSAGYQLTWFDRKARR